ncbi:MAG TPA: efflux RND transporter periplasmic adaptor subunit, partial [Thermomonas sp.]|nr:efflux RND transporter periplasmic adaptor subunit [Thermomonas sp.]
MSRPDELLNPLRIDRTALAPPPSRRGLWLALAIALQLLVWLVAWLALRGPKAVEVHTGTV